MTQDEAATEFQRFEKRVKHNGSRATAIGDTSSRKTSRQLTREQVVNRFILENGCDEHREHLLSIARDSYRVDSEKWSS